MGCAGANQIEVQSMDQAFADLNCVHWRSIHSGIDVRYACTLYPRVGSETITIDGWHHIPSHPEDTGSSLPGPIVSTRKHG